MFNFASSQSAKPVGTDSSLLCININDKGLHRRPQIYTNRSEREFKVTLDYSRLSRLRSCWNERGFSLQGWRKPGFINTIFQPWPRRPLQNEARGKQGYHPISAFPESKHILQVQPLLDIQDSTEMQIMSDLPRRRNSTGKQSSLLRGLLPVDPCLLLKGMVEEPTQSHCSSCRSHSSPLVPVTGSKIRGCLWDPECQQKISNSLVFNSNPAFNYSIWFFLCEMGFL